MADSSEEKTEAPTSKRRSDARQRGEVARSTEINSVLVLLAGLIILRICAEWMYQEMSGSFRTTFNMMINPSMTISSLMRVFLDNLVLTGRILMPVCVGIMIVGVIANVGQIGFLLTGKPLEPNLEKINPIAGFKRLFSMRSMIELVKNILKIIIVALVAYSTIKGEFDNAMMMAHATAGAILLFLLKVTFTIFMRVAIILLILAIADFIYQRFEHEKKLKMSQQEVKDERKQMEGDPKVKARIRSLQMEMARRRMMREVPKATVVVTNPTHLAIALKYVPAEMQAPVVLAKGKRLIAERIKEIAREAGIPIVEDKPLARAMYDRVQPGDEVPADFYTAIAEILAYVYRLRNRKAA
jgi:flagellar biosynthetic protein FlhB